jgi:sporulation protein YlmC with PRC-barrel domain
MYIDWSKLNHLAVITEGGRKIGIVEGVTVDVESHAIKHYEVKPGGAVLGLLRRPLLVSPSEVVNITTEQMTVKETFMPIEASSGQKTRLVLSRPETGVEMSEME